jgi:hypothetical protein
MSDYDWDKYQRQLDRANPGEIRRESAFLEGLTPAEVNRQDAMIRGTQDASVDFSGAMMDEENAAEQRRIDLWEERGLHPWEMVGTSSPSAVTGPNAGPSRPTQNPAMLSDLIKAQTQASAAQTSAEAQVLSSVISAGSSIAGSFIGSDATKTAAKTAAEVGFDSNEVERLKARITEADVVNRARRMEAQTVNENKGVLLDIYKAIAAELPKFKLKTAFGEITGHQSDEANWLMNWAAKNFDPNESPAFWNELSNDATQKLVNEAMVFVDIQSSVGNALHTGGSNISSVAREFLGMLRKGASGELTNELKGAFGLN